jgi:hypothetical protein
MPVLRKHEKYCDDVRRLSEAGLSDSEIAERIGANIPELSTFEAII